MGIKFKNAKLKKVGLCAEIIRVDVQVDVASNTTVLLIVNIVVNVYLVA